MEQSFVDIELDSAREMLAGDQGLDDTGDPTLLVNVNERFEMHRVGERCKGGEYLGMRRRVEIRSDRIDAHCFIRCCGINQVWQSTVSL